MGKNIMLTSTKSGAGKSVVAIGLFLKMKEMGKRMGYFKPIGDAMTRQEKSRTDKDVSVISSVVARKFSKEEICPYFLNPESYLDEILPEDSIKIHQKIRDTFSSIEAKSDYIIIEGNHSYNQYSPVNLDDLYFAKEFNADMVICAPISDDNDLNSVIFCYKYITSRNLKVLGVVLNARTKTAEVRIQKYHKKILAEQGIRVIGSLQNVKDLEKPTIAEIMDATGAKLYSGDFLKVKNQLVGSFIIGAMGVDAALKILRTNIDKCVITGGDRTDIALAALDTSTKVIIFTGNMDPVPRVVSVAQEKEVPLLTTNTDTFTVAEQIRRIKTHIQPNEIQICRDQVENLNIDILFSENNND
ncbi:DRTGG domain-containing protein [Candidatus Harpocratesius sp.]